jgi:3'(2'), 5'-bisphosphate nucleotidase
MTSSLIPSLDLLGAVADLARRAGDAIMEIYQADDFGETRKADESPLTLADLAAHRVIVAGLREIDSDCPVLSEEDADIPLGVRQAWPRFWLVDPLDGTKEFIKRNGEFTVNIALIEAGRPVLGVVYAPVLDVCYLGVEGVGAFIQRSADPAESISVKNPAADSLLRVVASRSHSDARTVTLLQSLGGYQCLSMGSSLKLCLVAEGAADFYPRLGPTMEWDTAAAHAIVAAAGGVVCDLAGHFLTYNKADLHNPEFFVFHHEASWLLDRVRQTVVVS